MISKFQNIGIKNYGVTFGTTNKVATESITTNPRSGTCELSAGCNYPINPKISIPYKKISIMKTSFGDVIELYELSNGHKIAIVPKKSSTIVQTFVNCGSMNENDNIRGISHFIEHNLFNGSETIKPKEFFKEVSKLGANTNAATGFASTNYYISSSLAEESDVKKIIEMQGDMIYRPLFREDMIEKEKGPVLSEISMVEDDEENKLINETIRNLFNIKTTSKDMLIGSIETVSNLKREDLIDYHKKYYSPDNMYTVIVGDVNPDEVMSLVSKNFNGEKQAKQISKKEDRLIQRENAIRKDYISHKSPTGSIVIGLKGSETQNLKDKIIIDTISSILIDNKNSRLRKKIEETQGQISIETEKISTDKTQPLATIIYAGSQAGKEQETLDIIYDTILEIKKNPITEQELQIGKVNILKRFSENMETSSLASAYIGEALLNGNLEEFANYKHIVENLTLDDIQKGIENYFDLSKASIAVMHPKDTKDTDIADNYKKSKYSIKSKNNISFKGKVTKEKIELDDVKELTLNNNNNLVLSNSQNGISKINWKIKSNDLSAKNPSIYYVLEEILNHGTENKTPEEIENEKALNGIDYSINFNNYSINFNCSCFEKDTIKALDLLKEHIMSPNFTQEEFERAKKRVTNDFESIDKEADTYCLKSIIPNFTNTKEEVLSGLENLTLYDVRKYLLDLLSNSSSYMSITAPIKNDKNLENSIVNTASSIGINFKPKSPEPNQIFKKNEEINVFIREKEQNQANISQYFSYKITNNLKDEITMKLLDLIIGGDASSRLFTNLREKEKLAYSTWSQVSTIRDIGIFSLCIDTTTDNKLQNDINYDNIAKSINGFNSIIQDIKNNKITEEELNIIKKNLKQNIAHSLETNAHRNSIYLENMALPCGITRLENYFQTIDSITTDDIKQMANYIFSNKPSYAITASKDTLKNQSEFLNSLGMVKEV